MLLNIFFFYTFVNSLFLFLTFFNTVAKVRAQTTTTVTIGQKLRWGLTWRGAAERHEHTLTALWDHEAERKGAEGQGPGWLQAIRTAQPRR